MFRRCISLLLIIGFVASQLAAMPHSHGVVSALEQQQHDARPHVHGEGFGCSEHGHEHASGRNGHSHAVQERKASLKSLSDDSDGQPLATGLDDTDHDADAIFVSAQTATVLTAKDQVWQLVALAPLPECVDGVQAYSGPAPRWHPPDEVLDASDTYLTLRNLRL